jgi:hypothetical protein
MSTTTSKNKRVKFGLFKSESAAQEECDKRKSLFPEDRASFYVKKLERNKSGKNSWLAYCLLRKRGM